ncbi:MAG TPA: S8 family serine peptidase [Gaiellaceae bacterium]|nr:S8 family serine peptidase [Gaiellaceae bacterium]
MARFTRVALAIAVALALVGTALAATSASITITSVAGQPVVKGSVQHPVSGTVDVRGTAALATADEETPAARPLVADAGDTPFVATGESATLLGAGFGGAEPYTFAWSATSGELVGGNSPTAQLRGLAAGTHVATLTVTDAAGTTATDTVKVVVYERQQRTLLDKTHLEPTPGALSTGVPGVVKFPFTVPVGTMRIDAKLTHVVPANDWDLALVDPEGRQRAFGGKFVPNTQEIASVEAPEVGTWSADAQKYVTASDELRMVVTATIAPGGDPRPKVVSGGPYRFEIGATQTLRATVTGGAAPVAIGWDLDGDGVYEAKGAEVTADFAEGRYLVTVKATDASGHERRETTSVLVADPARLAAETTPVTVIAIADTGINPYHLEFSAATYPDPEVLELTANFTRHPSEYIAGYPQDAQALPVTLGQGYYPAADKSIWTGNTTIQAGKTYWIPGTKIVGAIDAGGSTGVTSGEDTHPILDDNGHGSGSASVSAGNRYGYCPTCLLFVVEALDASVAGARPWVDISSNSFGTPAGAPVGLLGGDTATRDAVERGQTVLFAAGNGVGNAFDVPQLAWGSRTVGPDWNVVVGAVRRDNQRAIVGDAIPVHISAWGDGNLPSACRTGTVGQCAFGGTSAATPYTAGVFGTVLTEVRRALGDARNGQRPGQVIAEGLPIDESVYLADGKLTRAELREAVLKTAVPLNQRNEVSPFPYPLTAPYTGDANVLFEGYGAATPESAKRALDVLLGRATLPERPFEDEFFALDRQVRDTLYGGYDRDGNGTRDSEALSALSVTPEQVSTLEGTLAALRAAAEAKAGTDLQQVTGSSAIAYYLHRVVSAEPGRTGCGGTINESYMDRSDTTGDLEPCFESRITSVAAAYRPLGIFPSKDTLDAPLAAGSTVSVDLYIAGETPSVVRPTGVLMATDREIGSGVGPLLPVTGSGPGGVACSTLGDACWTRYRFAFKTTRPAFRGEQLTFQVQLVGARSWAFGYEGTHASKLEITPAPVPAQGHELAVTITEPANGSRVSDGRVVAGGTVAFPNEGTDPTGAGGHPRTKRVLISVDDPTFAKPVEAQLHSASGTWSVDLGALGLGEHTVYAKATLDRVESAVASSRFTVTENAVVQWQVVAKNGAPKADAWQPASGIRDWAFAFDSKAYGSGPHSIVVRLLQGSERAETARSTVRVKLK